MFFFVDYFYISNCFDTLKLGHHEGAVHSAPAHHQVAYSLIIQSSLD